MISTLKLYGRAAKGFYGAAARIVALKSAASLLEAVGLVLLLQLLGGALRGSADLFTTGSSAKLFLKLVGSVPVDSQRGIVVFAAMGILAVLFKFLGEILLCVTLSGAEESLRRRHSRAVVGIEWESFLKTRLGNSSDFLLARGAHLGLAVNSFIYFISETLSAVLCFAIALVVAPTMTLTIGGVFLAMTIFLRRIGGRLERH